MLLQVYKDAAYLVSEDLASHKMDIRAYDFFIAQRNKYGDATSVMADEELITLFSSSWNTCGLEYPESRFGGLCNAC